MKKDKTLTFDNEIGVHIAGDRSVYNRSSCYSFQGKLQDSHAVALSCSSFKIQKGSLNLCFTVSISLDAENRANEGYQSMLQNLIRLLKDGRRCWVKQEEFFTLTLLDKAVAFPVTLYNSECLRASKVSNLPPSCGRFRRDCFTNKSVCGYHTDLYDSWKCNVSPCETCARLLNESKNLVYKQVWNSLSILDQEPA